MDMIWQDSKSCWFVGYFLTKVFLILFFLVAVFVPGGGARGYRPHLRLPLPWCRQRGQQRPRKLRLLVWIYASCRVHWQNVCHIVV